MSVVPPGLGCCQHLAGRDQGAPSTGKGRPSHLTFPGLIAPRAGPAWWPRLRGPEAAAGPADWDRSLVHPRWGRPGPPDRSPGNCELTLRPQSPLPVLTESYRCVIFIDVFYLDGGCGLCGGGKEVFLLSPRPSVSALGTCRARWQGLGLRLPLSSRLQTTAQPPSPLGTKKESWTILLPTPTPNPGPP